MVPYFTFDEYIARLSRALPPGPTLNSRLARYLNLPPMDAKRIHQQMRRLRGIYDAMTAAERADPGALNSSHRRRIARGAGVPITEVSQMIRQFEMTCEIMQRRTSASWSRRFVAVLGLVTGSRRWRDPSYGYPLPDRATAQFVEAGLSIAAIVLLIAVAYSVLGH
jgi:hypothetical protein